MELISVVPIEAISALFLSTHLYPFLLPRRLPLLPFDDLDSLDLLLLDLEVPQTLLLPFLEDFEPLLRGEGLRGFLVGFFVGNAVGNSDGEEDGLLDLEGDMLGLEEGLLDTDGFKEGCELGAEDSDGELEGSRVGFFDGDEAPDEVGAGVGY